jgi:dipeptidyl aminopeptidase/acylaminoacyl peptidase
MTSEEYLNALLTLPRLVATTASRDGQWVAWTWFGAGPAADVFAAPTDASREPLRLTDTPDHTYVVSWTPDSRSVLVAQDKNGNERATIYRVDLDNPLTMVPLTDLAPNYFIRGGDLHPNGRWLVYGANVDAATGKEIEPTWMYRQDLETGEKFVLARPQKGGYNWPELSPSGEHVLYTRKDLHPAGWQVWLVGIDGANDHEILNFGADVKTFASWFPDGRRILVTTETPTHKRIGIYDLASSKTTWLVDDRSRNIESAHIPFNSDAVVLCEVTRARLRCSLLNLDTGIESSLPDLPGNLNLIAPAADREWVGVFYSSCQPQDVVRLALHRDPQKFTSIARIWDRTPLRAEDLTAAEDFHWKSVDGLEVQGWLYRPKGQARGTIIYVHGGPTSHSQDAINIQIQFFVSQRFNVLDPNYRGSTGFSMAFREKIKEDGWGGREQEDIRAGIEALIAAGIAERGKVGITGTSYGGYSAWHAITHFPPELLAASAPVCGMTDLVVDYQTTRPDLRPYSEEMLGGKPDEVPARYYERSPINFVKDITGNLLIVQGTQDPNVTPENVSTVTEALRSAEIEYALLAFDDEGHGIARPENQKTLYQELERFFGKAFGG